MADDAVETILSDEENETTNDDTSSINCSRRESRLYTYKYKDVHIEIHQNNVNCLKQEEYLNDNVVQFFTAFLKNQCCKREIFRKVHVFDNIFYSQLISIFQKKVDVDKWHQLSKWYDSIDIFEKDFLIFPVCLENHWFVIIVCYPSKAPGLGEPKREVNHTKSRLNHRHSSTIETDENSSEIISIDDDDNSECDGEPSILLLDSLRLESKSMKMASMKVREFLDFEWRKRRKGNKNFYHHSMPEYNPSLPKQDNAYDCGVYMLFYIKAFLEQPYKFSRLASSGSRESQSTLRKQVNMLLGVNPRNQLYRLVEAHCRLETCK